jgi:hypothetical protein
MNNMNILRVSKLINFYTFNSVQHRKNNKINAILYIRDRMSPTLQACFKKNNVTTEVFTFLI